MSASRPKARLMCQSGELAGTSFELGESNTIGTKETHDIVIESSSLSPNHARILYEEGHYFLEDLGSSDGIRLDGVLVDRRMKLGRVNVIELSEALEFLFVREGEAAEKGEVAEKGEATRDEETAKPAEPEAAPAEPEAPDPSHTVVDMKGFGALPEQFQTGAKEASHEAEEEPPKGKEEEPPKGKEEEPEKEAEDAGEVGHTVVDMEGFGTLPDQFQKGREETPSEGASDKAAPDESEEAEGPPPPDEGATVVSPHAAAPEAPRRLQLEFASAEGEARSYELKEGDYVLGRGQSCDITLADPEMWLSREHAVVRVRKDSIELEDLESVNGTFVQGGKIEKVTLEPGASFSLGPHLNFTIREP